MMKTMTPPQMCGVAPIVKEAARAPANLIWRAFRIFAVRQKTPVENPQLDAGTAQNQNPRMVRADVSALGPSPAIDGRATTSFVASSIPSDPPATLAAFTDRILRHRLALYVVLAITGLAAFNGQWRAGRDSAAFRGIARNLVRHHTYEYRPKIHEAQAYYDKQDTLYPGFPIVLAGLQIMFGEGVVAPLMLMYAVAVGTLLLVYRLCRLYVSEWLAVTVVVLLGLNSFYLEHANEVLSDLPFLFGLVLALYGFELLRRAQTGRQWAGAISAAAGGLVLAASLRPTFWFLALAWLAACGWGLIRGRHALPDGTKRRGPYAVALAMFLFVFIAMVVLDPRTKNPVGTGYESRLVQKVSRTREFLRAVPRNLRRTLVEHVPAAFFGTTVKTRSTVLRVVAAAYSLMVIGGGAWLVRRNVLWGVLVVTSVGSFVMLGDNPRYYLMITPLLLLGWGLFCAEVARRMGQWRHMPALAMAWGLGIVFVPNLGRDLDFIREQRGFDTHLRHRSFLEVYRGKVEPTYRTADLLRRFTRPEQRILGPESTVTTFLADRSVYGLNRLLPENDHGAWPKRLADLHFDYVLFPPAGQRATSLYEKERLGAEAIDGGILVPTREVARTSDGIRLCEFRIESPATEPSR
jgi:hypothetical protein